MRSPSLVLASTLRLLGSTALAASALVACGDDGGTSGAGGAGGTGGAGGLEPEVCDGRATPGPLVFTDQTDAWGLAGVSGGRVTSGDLNGDGYPDLLVHGFAPNVREVKGEDPRRVYVLMNEPGPSGGRTFVDRTYESGFAVPADGSTTELKSSHFAVLGDVDNDGDLDVFSGTYSDLPAAMPPTPADLDRSEIYLNDGAGKFTRKDASGVAFENAKRTSSGTFADINLDGVIDLFVGVHYTASGALSAPALYLGNGDGSFGDVTVAMGINKERRAHFGATSCDLNDDGLPELLTSAYARGPNVLFRLNADGLFEDVGEESGYAFDANQDYTDNQFFLCWCTVNASDPLCAGVPGPAVGCPSPADSYWSPDTETQPQRLGGNTFTTVCSDVTGDGKLDLYTAEIHHWWAGGSSDSSNLLSNAGGPGEFKFERADRAATGLEVPHPTPDWNEGGITALAADLDGDARQDLVLGASDYPDQFSWVFQQKADGTFAEQGEAVGLHHPCAVGLTTADFDRDGDLDVVVASGTARDCAQIWPTNEVHLYESGLSADASWIAVRPRGAGAGAANVAGIGSRVTVEAGGVKQTQQLTSGYGHFGLQNDTALFFRLGDCARAASIEVVWPDGSRSTTLTKDVVGGRLIEIRQADGAIETIAPAP